MHLAIRFDAFRHGKEGKSIFFLFFSFGKEKKTGISSGNSGHFKIFNSRKATPFHMHCFGHSTEALFLGSMFHTHSKDNSERQIMVVILLHDGNWHDITTGYIFSYMLYNLGLGKLFKNNERKFKKRETICYRVVSCHIT